MDEPDERERTRRLIVKEKYDQYKLLVAIIAIVGVAVSIATISITIYNVNLVNVTEQIAKACLEHEGEWVVGPDGQKECVRTTG